MSVRGLLLAAGAGRRMGEPKALVDDWLVRSVRTLTDGGCDAVTVVLGAEADRAGELLAAAGLDALVDVVVAEDWATGMGASLRAGLDGLAGRDGLAGLEERAGVTADAAVVTLVDLPDVGAEVVRRVLAAGADAATLRRATYDGKPGHPVVLGRDHWAAVAATAVGDRGARNYLAAQEVETVECADLATGRDVDRR